MQHRKTLLLTSILVTLALCSALFAAPVVIDLKASSSGQTSNCAPIGRSFPNYMGAVYRDVPPFNLKPGDTIAFDTYGVNNTDIVQNIALAATLSNGSTQPSGAFVQVASGIASTPRGNIIIGDYDLSWTATGSFNFAGGGLVVRFQPTGAYLSDTSCTAGYIGGSGGNLVGRFYNDPDGVYAWTSFSAGPVPDMRLTISSGGGGGGGAVPSSSTTSCVIAGLLLMALLLGRSCRGG